MTEIKPRYEFRIFGPHLDWIGEKIRSLAGFDRYRESREIYIISRNTDHFNTKIRNKVLDIKKKIQVVDGLEQWEPVIKAEFPLDKDILLGSIIPALYAVDMAVGRASYTLPEFLDDLVQTSSELALAHVLKRRYGYQLDECTIEFADVYVNGAMQMTVCLESEDPEIVRRVRNQLGLEAHENVNYLEAIKRILGLKPLPGDSVYNASNEI
jgi:hypothetical protein